MVVLLRIFALAKANILCFRWERYLVSRFDHPFLLSSQYRLCLTELRIPFHLRKKNSFKTWTNLGTNFSLNADGFYFVSDFIFIYFIVFLHLGLMLARLIFISLFPHFDWHWRFVHFTVVSKCRLLGSPRGTISQNYPTNITYNVSLYHVCCPYVIHSTDHKHKL